MENTLHIKLNGNGYFEQQIKIVSFSDQMVWELRIWALRAIVLLNIFFFKDIVDCLQVLMLTGLKLKRGEGHLVRATSKSHRSRFKHVFKRGRSSWRHWSQRRGTGVLKGFLGHDGDGEDTLPRKEW